MTTIQASVVNGQIVPKVPVQWADGTVLDITEHVSEEEDLFSNSPESIARWLALYRSLDFPRLTSEESAAMDQHFRENREQEIATLKAREDALITSMP